jgi:hypothetical protein
MAVFSLSASAGEALVLGLATGPVCLATCGPVVVPWMMVQPQGVRGHSRQLALFLAARLAGYMVFATAVWLVGSSIQRAWPGRAGIGQSWLMGGIEVLLAAALVVYAVGWPHRRCAAANPAYAQASARHGEAGGAAYAQAPARHEARDRLVRIGEGPRPLRSGALALGFLTGINLCPPFLVAGVRAAELVHLSAALVFFVCFFAGTAVWFLPFLSMGFVQRTPAVVTVARMVAVLLACWYGISGVYLLIERTFYG